MDKYIMSDQTITATNLRRQLRGALKAVDSGKPVFITRHGKTVAALVPGTMLGSLGITPPAADAPSIAAQNVDADGAPVAAAETVVEAELVAPRKSALITEL